MFDGSDLRVFLAIQRTGSLSAAARTLRVNQTTAGRRLAELEQALGARLFDRLPAGRALTQYQRLSSGLVGCAPEQIEIANERPMATVVTWEAVCNGHRFFCSGAEHIASCKESPATSEKQAAPATSEPVPAPAA